MNGMNATKTIWIVSECLTPTHVLKTLQVRIKNLSLNKSKRPKMLNCGWHFGLQPFFFCFLVQCDDKEGNKVPGNVIDVDEGIGKQIWIKNI